MTELLVITWTIYGHTLYFSTENDCASKGFSFLALMMFGFLIFGYLHLLLYFMIVALVVYVCIIKKIHQR